MRVGPYYTHPLLLRDDLSCVLADEGPFGDWLPAPHTPALGLRLEDLQGELHPLGQHLVFWRHVDLANTTDHHKKSYSSSLQYGDAVRVVVGTRPGRGIPSTCTHHIRPRRERRNVQDDQPCARYASEHTQAGACNFDYKPHEDSVPRDRMP